MRIVCCVLGLLSCLPALLYAQASDEGAPLFYVVKERPTVFFAADSTMPFDRLDFRESVQVINKNERWARIRRADGTVGYVDPRALSNVWIRVSKSRQTVFVYRGVQLIKRYGADMGHNLDENKRQRGTVHDPDTWITPEGVFFVCGKNPNSRYYKALVLNYPTPEFAEMGLRRGTISEKEYAQIVYAAKNFRPPPMNTAMGGWIEIHGHGTGGETNWTRGCVALRDEHIDEIWDLVEIGTPVIIER